MDLVVGIDPGITGAIAVVEGSSIWLYDMPVKAKSSGKGNMVNAYALGRYIPMSSVVMVEEVGPMPKQGVTSVFSFGRSLGVIEGFVAAHKMELRRVRPNAWKKHFGLTGKDKDAARGLAIELYPSVADELSRKKDCGRADALLIAAYALATA